MKQETILGHLCAYDKRNPYYVETDEDDPRPPRTNCFCDSCFRGTDELALEILQLQKTVPDLLEACKLVMGTLKAYNEHTQSSCLRLCVGTLKATIAKAEEDD